MGKFELWGSCFQRSMLVFTLALLLCEILVGRLCHSLINMVDSFHTLYVLIHICLYPSTMPVSSFTSPDHKVPIAKHFTSPNSTPTATADTTLPVVESAHPGVSKAFQYSKLRIPPFVALISAMLLVSLCICFTFEILSHLVQPHSIQHPLLAAAVGAASLLFNTLMLVWKSQEQSDMGVKVFHKEAKRGQTVTQSEPFTSEDNAKENTQFEKETGRSFSLDDGTLMFCNPGAGSVVDPDIGSQESSSLAGSCPITLGSHPVHQSKYAENPISHDSIECQQSQQTIQQMDPVTEGANCKISLIHTANLQPLTTELCTRMDSKHTRQNGGHFLNSMSVIRSLLGSVLVLVNGLILLFFKPQCLNSYWSYHIFAYLDPGFSMLTVLVLLTTTMPELWHHGLLVLQAFPKHLSVEEMMDHISNVSDVLSVHELHVWQLSETCLVASVHVHCRSDLGAQKCSQLLSAITDVLRGFGIGHCTVQPEFLPICESGAECIDSHVEEAKLAMTNSAEQKFCSLRCGKECAKNMCCLSEENSLPTAFPPLHMKVKQQDVIIENTHV